MTNTLLRLLWRFLLFFSVGVVIFQILFSPFPYLKHDYWAVILALLTFYILLAYLTMPLLIRLWRVVIKPNHIPVYAITADGWASDPVNIAIVCQSRTKLINIMGKAGWTIADPITFRTSLRMIYAVLFKKSYPTAPFSKLFLFDRAQDVGFQIQEGDPPTPRHRHHIRFWQLPEQLTADNSAPHGFWYVLFQRFLKRKKQIWIGAATHDISSLAFRYRTLQLTHKIDNDTNLERDFVIATLEEADFVRTKKIINSGHSLTFRGQTFGSNIIVDGNLTVVELK